MTSSSLIEGNDIDCYTFPSKSITYDNKFTLNVDGGTFRKGEVILLVGENGTGKTTFIKNMVNDREKMGNLKMSHKSQNPYNFGSSVKSDTTVTVKELLDSKGLTYNATFVSIVIKPLRIDKMYESKVNNISGGQAQRLSLALCLGNNTDMYLLDEPSAYIDVDDRLHVAKIICRYARLYNKTIFIVEHDIIMASSISDKVIVFSGIPGKLCRAESPKSLSEGINEFLKSINITIHKTSRTGRPRINKLNGQRDKQQKREGNYYLID